MFRCNLLSALVVVLSLSWNDSTNASSPPARPLKRLGRPSTIALEILPRQPPHISSSQPGSRRSLYPLQSTLRHTDSFRLTLSAFGSDFYLHLRPNDHLVHPSARVTYYATDPLTGLSVATHTEPLLRESVKAYWGEVVPLELSAEHMREDASGLQRPPGRDLGWARISVYHQGDVDKGIAPVFEGAFSVNGVVHHIMTKENYSRHRLALDPELVHTSDDDPGSPLVIWRDSDVMSSIEEENAQTGGILDTGSRVPSLPQACGHDSLPYNKDPRLHKAYQSTTTWYDSFGLSGLNSSFIKRDDVAGGSMSTNFESTIGQTTGCPSTQKIVYMGVAADCQYTATYGTPQNATQQILTNWNTASSLYKSTFNVSLGIIELQVHNSTCPSPVDPANPWNVDCYSNVTLNDRLSLFSAWRGQMSSDGAGLWHLMSGCPTGSEVGIAWLNTLCQQSSSGTAPSVVSGTAVSTSGRTEWQVIAHEIGHNFGAIHDCTSGCNSTTPCCPFSSSSCDANSQFIMSPVAETGEMQFSQCSLGNICSLLTSHSSCLIDASAAQHIISLQMCGNGIVETGEDCDPGLGVNSTCCDSTTCKFRAGALCDPESSPCCTEQCSLAPPTQVCRPSRDSSCDTAEMCTGNSSSCPADVFSPNGQSCGSGGLACASGLCTSLSKQCQTAGSSMNLQQACPSQNDKSCQVSCQDPANSNQCVVLQTALIDGSTCGYGGMCIKGQCQSGGLLDTAKAWYVQNLQISIPVTVGVGIILLLIIWGVVSCVRRCYRRNQGLSMSNTPIKAPFSKVQGHRLSSWGPGPPPPDMIGNTETWRQPLTQNESNDVYGEHASMGTRGSINNPPPEPMYDNRPNGTGLAIPSRRRDLSWSPVNNWVDTTPYNGSRR